MSEIKAGVVAMSLADLSVLLHDPVGGSVVLAEQDELTAVAVNRRRNPPVLGLKTGGGWAREATFPVLARHLHLPPMHQVTDVWVDTQRGIISFKVEGGQLPVVKHGADVPDILLIVEPTEARPGEPSFLKGRFEKKAA